MEHKQLKPQLSNVRLANLNINNFKTIEVMGLKNYCLEVTLNGITSLPNFVKIYPAVQNLLLEDIQTDTNSGTQTGEFKSLFLFLKSTLNISPTTHLWRRRGQKMCSSYLFTTSALDAGEWLASRPGRALLPGKGPPVFIARWNPDLNLLAYFFEREILFFISY
jgi:hypothetical protein